MIESFLPFSPDIIVLLIGTAAVAGFIDAIAGGGGLITVPALMLAGLPPATAIATNKVQSVFGSGSATLAFARAGMIEWRQTYVGIICVSIGAMAGATVLQYVSADFLRDFIPVLLIAVALYFALAPKLTDESRHHLMSHTTHNLLIGSSLGFYEGFFGPGFGSFLVVSYVVLRGCGIRKATAHTKLLNFVANASSLFIYLLAGQAMVKLGLIMAIGQLCGATLGAHVAIRHGSKVIRPLLVTMCCAMAAKLLLS